MPSPKPGRRRASGAGRRGAERAGGGADDLPFLLGMAFRALTDRFHARLAELGREPLRPAHGYAFRFLAAREVTTTVELAAHLGVTKQAASKAVAELEGWGYVERRPHPGDRRAQALALTPRGREYVALADRLWAELVAEWAQLVGPDRLAATADDLRALVAAWAGEAPALRPVW